MTEERGRGGGRSWPVRVCVVAPTTEIVGGQSVQATWLISRLDRVPGLEVSLLPINPRLPGPLRALQRLKYLRTLVTEAWYLLTLLRRLRTADVVHVFSASYFSFLLAPTPAILVARLYGKRVILHYHSGEADDHLRRWRRTAVPTLRLADRIVVPSAFLVEVFARHGLEAEAIPNFVRRDYVRFRRRGHPRPVFLANRNLEPIYNVSCLLRAFARIQRRYPEASLLLAGDGSRRRALEREARELGLRNVEFLGQIPPPKMGRLYDRADIYLNASDVDNMPLSILESFAAGLPVVTTDAGGIPYVARDGHNALLVPRDDDEALAASALRLLEEPGLAESVVERARREFEERYLWEAVGQDWVELYRVLLESPLRVCIVAPSTDIVGGQAVQAERLRRRLVDVDDLAVRFLPVNPRLSRPLRWLQRIKYVRTAVTEARYLWDLLSGLRHADVVHIFSASYLSFVLAPTPAILVSRLYGCRSVLNYRSGEAEDHLNRWRRTALPTVRRVDEVVVASEYLRQVFARFGVPSRAIPNLVELERYRFRRRHPLRPVFFANRNLEAHYNVACILHAFALIQERRPEARLLVAGDGSRRSALEALTAELALRNVEFLGQVRPEEMPEWYDRAEIYINASEIDNMPTSIIEAFAAGLPVVSTAAGGIPYMVRHGENGLLVEPGDHHGLAREALRLLEEPDLADGLVERAREDCRRRYTWSAVRDAWVGLYRELGSLPAKAEGTLPSDPPPVGVLTAAGRDAADG